MTDSIASFLNNLTKEEIVPKVYSNTVLSNLTKKNLLSYQEAHVVKLITILLANHVALDASDTGIGKTYVASGTCGDPKTDYSLSQNFNI